MSEMTIGRLEDHSCPCGADLYRAEHSAGERLIVCLDCGANVGEDEYLARADFSRGNLPPDFIDRMRCTVREGRDHEA